MSKQGNKIEKIDADEGHTCTISQNIIFLGESHRAKLTFSPQQWDHLLPSPRDRCMVDAQSEHAVKFYRKKSSLHS